ncbi:MAG: TadE/TadG family type IV pilus assembly protein [Actinomycetota bacterium]
MRLDRLLTRREPRERGSAVVESIFAILMLLVLVLGAIEVAFALYGRNVLMTSAHEGARAAIEIGRDPSEAEALALRTVERAAGGLVEALQVRVASLDSGSERRVIVQVRGRVRALGPVPLRIPVEAIARTSSSLLPP